MDYKEKIMQRWPGKTRVERSNSIIRWLDQKLGKGWQENQSEIAADTVLLEAVGTVTHGRMTVEETEAAEEFINDYYLMEGVV